MVKSAPATPPIFPATYEVDTRSATEDVGTWHDSLTSSQPFGRSRVVEGSCLRVELHVLGVYARPKWVSHVSYANVANEPTLEPMDC